jgi:FkbM family methyltransferase
MYREGTLEPELTRIIALLARPNDVFVDIGANVGWHSLSLLRHRPDVRMSYAFEPARRTFEMLEAGVTANGLAARCKIRQCAIGQHETSMRLKSFATFGSTHSSMYPLADWPYTEEDVPVFSLDMLARDFVSLPSLIKCDVEGAERDVLLGASELMSGRAGPPPIWLLEANYETSGMAGFFPYQLLELAAARATYEGFIIREGRVVPLPSPTSLRHGDTLILAVPAVHRERLAAAG